MISQAVYRTNYGEVVAAAAKDEFVPSHLKTPADQAGVQVIKTAGGLELLIAVVATSHDAAATADQPDPMVARVFHYCQESISSDVPEILIGALAASKDGLGASAEQNPETQAEAIIAVHDRKLYLAKVGDSRAYLVRGDHIVQISRDHSLPGDLMHMKQILDTQPIGSTTEPEHPTNQSFQPAYQVDSTILLPGGEGKPYLTLTPGDGVILSTDGLVEPIASTGVNKRLKSDFQSLYLSHSPSVIADRMLQAASASPQNFGRSLVVLKSEESSQPVALASPFGSSCLGQIGVLGLILIVSIGLGLAAAVGAPAILNPKPVPVTSSTQNASGFISVLAADGLVQAKAPGTDLLNLAAGGVLKAIPNTAILTVGGTAKLQLVDGTNFYVDSNTTTVLAKIADPKEKQYGNQILLTKGAVIVDDSHTEKTPTTISIQGINKLNASGNFLAIEYFPSQSKVTFACLQGPCEVNGASSPVSLQSGEMVSWENGKFSTVSPVDWNRWLTLCNTDCPVQPLQVLPTPTTVPTPVPYLGSMLIDPTLTPTGIFSFGVTYDPGQISLFEQATPQPPDPTATAALPSPLPTATVISIATVIVPTKAPPPPQPQKTPQPKPTHKPKPPKPNNNIKPTKMPKPTKQTHGPKPKGVIPWNMV